MRFFKKRSPQSAPTETFSDVVGDFSSNMSVFQQHINAHFDTRIQDERRRQWFTSRLWHNGEHSNCCPKCLQAGYVMALVHTDRLDLLGEYPELITLYEELRRDGMLHPVMVKTR
jgi:hypothetical protein